MAQIDPEVIGHRSRFQHC